MSMTAAEKAFKNTSKKAVEDLNWEALEKVYYQYGVYLELVGGDGKASDGTVNSISYEMKIPESLKRVAALPAPAIEPDVELVDNVEGNQKLVQKDREAVRKSIFRKGGN